MTAEHLPADTTVSATEAPAPRPAWERVAYTWLAREVDGGHQVDPAALASEVSVNPRYTSELVRVLRAQRQRDPDLGELLGEPASHGQPTTEQLARLQAHFADGGHQQATVTSRPRDAERVAEEVERHYWTREVHATQPVDEAGLAHELGVPRRQVAEQLANLLGVTTNYVRHVTSKLRAEQGIAPLDQRAEATRAKLAQPPVTPTPDAQYGDWRRDAACREADTELFFPEESSGTSHQVTRAKEICASCQVRQPCLETALHGPQAHNDHHGIFAGTTAKQRVKLRGRPAMGEGTRFLQDRAAAEEALRLANQVSIDRAARELGVSKQALRRAFDYHELAQPAVFQGGPQRSRFYHDAEAARRAWQRAAEVGINQTRKELHTTDKALRTAWQRHGLGLPPRPPSGHGGHHQAAAEQRVDPAFVKLNQGVIPTRARNDAELAQRARRPARRQTERTQRQERAHTERAERSARPHHRSSYRDER